MLGCVNSPVTNFWNLGFLWWDILSSESGKTLVLFSIEIDNGTIDQLGILMTCKMFPCSMMIFCSLHDVGLC